MSEFWALREGTGRSIGINTLVPVVRYVTSISGAKSRMSRICVSPGAGSFQNDEMGLLHRLELVTIGLDRPEKGFGLRWRFFQKVRRRDGNAQSLCGPI